MNQFVSTQTEIPMPNGEYIDFSVTNKGVLLLLSSGLYGAGLDVQGNIGMKNKQFSYFSLLNKSVGNSSQVIVDQTGYDTSLVICTQLLLEVEESSSTPVVVETVSKAVQTAALVLEILIPILCIGISFITMFLLKRKFEKMNAQERLAAKED